MSESGASVAPSIGARRRPWIESVREDVREFFSLDRAEARARALSESDVADLERTLLVSGQRRDAAEILFHGGARAEALRALHDAVTLLRALPAARLSEAADGALEPGALPTLEQDFEPRHEQLFADLVEEHARLVGTLLPLAVGPTGRRAMRLERRVVAVATLLCLMILAVWWSRRHVVEAEASAVWGGKYVAANAVDGQEATHWLLPDMATGWLDLKLKPPRKVTTVSILNAYDPPNYAVVEYRLEARVGGRLVKAYDGTLPTSYGTKPPWVFVPFATDEKVDTIRIVVKSHRDLGAGLAEVKIE